MKWKIAASSSPSMPNKSAPSIGSEIDKKTKVQSPSDMLMFQKDEESPESIPETPLVKIW